MGERTHPVERCSDCQTIALKIAPGESVECESCGRTLVREDGEFPNEIHVQGEN